MPAGFQVFNQGGNLQIDADYSNYILSAKGTSVSGSRAPDAGYGFDVGSGRKNSIIAIRSSSFAAVFNSLDSAGNVVHRVVSEVSGASFDWWIFTADPAPAANSGFEVYNAQGVRVFQATAPYLKLLNFSTVAVGAGTSGNVSTPGKYPAWVSASYCALWEGSTVPNPGGGVISAGILRTLMGRAVSGGMDYKAATVYQFNANRGTSNNAYGSFFVVDVDNM